MSCEVFVGNLMTGNVEHEKCISISDLELESKLEEMISNPKIGWKHGVWAVYRDGHDTAEHAADFAQYMEYKRKHNMESEFKFKS